jgi:hypothetical protein
MAPWIMVRLDCGGLRKAVTFVSLPSGPIDEEFMLTPMGYPSGYPGVADAAAVFR